MIVDIRTALSGRASSSEVKSARFGGESQPAGVAGTLAGAAIIAGVVFSAPALIVVGVAVAAVVGVFHLVRWLSK